MTLPIQTPAYWDSNVSPYVQSAEPFTAMFCRDAVALAEIEPGLTLLDVATGPGALAIAAAQAGADVTAIDFSKAMIDQLATQIGALPIKAMQMDGQALDFPDATFDRACSVLGIPLFPDWRAGIRELVRVTKPGGRTVIGVADNGHGFGPNPLLARARADLTGTPAPVDMPAWAILAGKTQLEAELIDTGLVAIQIHDRTHDFLLDPASFVADHPMIAQNPVLAGLSDSDRAAVIAAAIADAHQQSDGRLLRLPGTARIAIGIRA